MKSIEDFNELEKVYFLVRKDRVGGFLAGVLLVLAVLGLGSWATIRTIVRAAVAENAGEQIAKLRAKAEADSDRIGKLADKDTDALMTAIGGRIVSFLRDKELTVDKLRVFDVKVRNRDNNEMFHRIDFVRAGVVQSLTVPTPLPKPETER